MLLRKDQNPAFDPNCRLFPGSDAPLTKSYSIKCAKLLLDHGAECKAFGLAERDDLLAAALELTGEGKLDEEKDAMFRFLLSRGVKPTLISLRPENCTIESLRLQLAALPSGKLINAFSVMELSIFFFYNCFQYGISKSESLAAVDIEKLKLLFSNLGERTAEVIQCYVDPKTRKTTLHLLAAHKERAKICDVLELEDLDMIAPDADGFTPLWLMILRDPKTLRALQKWPLTTESNSIHGAAFPSILAAIASEASGAQAANDSPNRYPIFRSLHKFPSQILVQDVSILASLTDNLDLYHQALLYRQSDRDPGPDFSLLNVPMNANPLVLLLNNLTRSKAGSVSGRPGTVNSTKAIEVVKLLIDYGISPVAARAPQADPEYFSHPNPSMFKFLTSLCPELPAGVAAAAVAQNSFNLVKWVLAAGADPNQLRQSNGLSALGTFFSIGMQGLDSPAAVSLFQALLEHGADLHKRDKFGTALFRLLMNSNLFQASSGMDSVLTMICDAGAVLSDVPETENPVSSAIRHTHAQGLVSAHWLSAVLARFPELATRGDPGATPLAVLCSLSSKMHSADSKTEDRTPPALLQTLHLLLGCGASLSDLSSLYRFSAITLHWLSFLAFVAERDPAWCNRVDPTLQRTPLMYSLEHDTSPALRVLLEAGCDANLKSPMSLHNFDEYPLVMAVVMDNLLNVSLLLSHGASIFVLSSSGHSLAELCRSEAVRKAVARE